MNPPSEVADEMVCTHQFVMVCDNAPPKSTGGGRRVYCVNGCGAFLYVRFDYPFPITEGARERVENERPG